MSEQVEIKVPSKMIAAAMYFAAKGDARYYLNGVRIGKDRVTATNGHVMLDHKLENESGLDADMIVAFKRAIPSDSYLTHFTVLDKDTVAVRHMSASGLLVGLDCCQIIDGKYPDVDKVLVPLLGEEVAVPTMTFNFSYLELAAKAAKKINKKWAAGKLRFYGPTAAIRIEAKCTDHGKAQIVIMPMRD